MTPTHEWDPSDWDALHQGGQREYDSPDRFDLGSLPRQLPQGRPPSGRHSTGRFPSPQPPPGPSAADRFPDGGFQPGQPPGAFPGGQVPEGQFPPEQFPSESRPPSPRRSSSSPSFPPASRADADAQGGSGRGGPQPAGPRRMHRSLVRPYARTGGRVAPATDLQLESLVSAYDIAGAIASGAVASTVQRFICDLCAEEVKSIAEIAAYARLPLGVVKVIVSDLADAGAVSIQRPGMVTGDRSSQAFMERILEGLKAL